MLYGTLKLLFRVTLRVFFRKVHLRNMDAIPRTGPLLVCANHPSAFMDPIVIATLMKRPVFFLAKASAFQSGFAKKIMPWLHVVPVYRKQDDPGQMHRNEEMFRKCFEHLGKGGAILIFPEGTSITERKLREIKTGAARIALGAEKMHGGKLGVQIVTIGLNYNDPHRFRQEVFINVDKPIQLDAYRQQYEHDEFTAVDRLTERIRERLEKHIISVADEQTDELVKGIEKLYKHKLLREQGHDPKEKDKDFLLTRRIVETVQHFSEREPERVARMREAIARYFTNVERAGLDDRLLDTNRPKGSRLGKNFGELLFILLGFPLFAYGILANYLPYRTVKSLVEWKVKQREFQGSVAMAAGMLLFLSWYTAIGIVTWKIFHSWYALLFTASLLPAGVWAFYYYVSLHHIGRRWFFASLFYKRSALVAELILQREAIIKEFDKAAEEYAKVVAAGPGGVQERKTASEN